MCLYGKHSIKLAVLTFLTRFRHQQTHKPREGFLLHHFLLLMNAFLTEARASRSNQPGSITKVSCPCGHPWTAHPDAQVPLQSAYVSVLHWNAALISKTSLDGFIMRLGLGNSVLAGLRYRQVGKRRKSK